MLRRASIELTCWSTQCIPGHFKRTSNTNLLPLSTMQQPIDQPLRLMIRSAREVILLADYTAFGEETGIQVAPMTVIHRMITDDALPPSIRFNISKAGIQIMIV